MLVCLQIAAKMSKKNKWTNIKIFDSSMQVMKGERSTCRSHEWTNSRLRWLELSRVLLWWIRFLHWVWQLKWSQFIDMILWVWQTKCEWQIGWRGSGWGCEWCVMFQVKRWGVGSWVCCLQCQNQSQLLFSVEILPLFHFWTNFRDLVEILTSVVNWFKNLHQDFSN